MNMHEPIHQRGAGAALALLLLATTMGAAVLGTAAVVIDNTVPEPAAIRASTVDNPCRAAPGNDAPPHCEQ
jgi:hypothetical protein